MKELHLTKKYIIIFIILLFISVSLLLTKISFGSDSKEELNTLEVPYSDEFYNEILKNGLTISAEDLTNKKYENSLLGVNIVKTPNFIRKRLPDPMMEISVDEAAYLDEIYQLAQNYTQVPEEAEVKLVDGELYSSEGRQGYSITVSNAVEKLKDALLNQSTVVTLDVKVIDMGDNNIQTFFLKNQLENIKSASFWIRYQTHSARIKGSELVKMADIPENKNQIEIDNENLRNYLNDKLSNYEIKSEVELAEWGWKDFSASDSQPDYDQAAKLLEEIINEKKIKSNNIIDIGSIIVPATNGDYSDRYIELDLSQQMMYLWVDGKLFKTYQISSGARNLTPVGIYKILNKSDNAWSPIYQKWMPYWMAFTYLYEYEGWLGFHELTYWHDEYGNKVFEDDDRIGTAVSGGCVRLSRGEAKEFYDWAEIGDSVLIHE